MVAGKSVKTLRILGTRGVPAAHGGFETFAERLALYLVAHGWRVIVYCQAQGTGPAHVDSWQGIERVTIPIARGGAAATIAFDWHATRHAAGHRDLCLTLGYNTALFCAWLRVRRVPNLINMDGIEWRRGKWGVAAKAWFWINERLACWLGDHLVADNPAIADHLATRVRPAKISTIAYGADRLVSTTGDIAVLARYGLTPRGFLTVIARAEPENSLLEVVSGFSRRARPVRLVVLGAYDDAHPYHRAVKRAASTQVSFVGAIYDRGVVQSLRVNSLAYVHGHQVGGTNPSLVEAMGAGNAVLAHDNRFNRWVAAEGARYFADVEQFAALLDELLERDPQQMDRLARASLARYERGLTWPQILGQYEQLLTAWLPPAASD